jgi:hypothetical protein
LGLYQFRYMSFFFMFSTVPLALHLDRLLPKQPNNLKIERSLLAAGVVAACALPLVYMRIDPALGFPQNISEQDVRYLQTHFSHARLLNHWNYGGVLIFHTRGAMPVFVDGRASTAYPDALLRDYFKLVQPEFDEAAWDTVLEKYKIDTVLWVKAHDELRRFLVGKAGRRHTQDRIRAFTSSHDAYGVFARARLKGRAPMSALSAVGPAVVAQPRRLAAPAHAQCARRHPRATAPR